MMKVKNMEDRVNDLESWAFRTGRDIAEMKAVQAEMQAVQADHTERLDGIERGVRALLDHYGIDPQPADA
ncbi:hypothetical protein LDL08_04420 [Nonomuraea glycinis]|uniref:Uncharacterized protein n=1 Tax=Nonomuraea glycinis TaxID=2047744 RepID=A0A918A3L2_9ACTN|nr:hypothetical protein [Nonomuraea glycinis]MCA2175423.1 hypothetical protein [Nonomuraea glycinis]GGP04694.1 hypothetical protein GCM10012278_20890 [Nonomuraea glycinis]